MKAKLRSFFLISFLLAGHVAFSAVVSSMQFFPQEQTEWCWAAVSQTLLASLASQKTEQCRLVGRIIGDKFCCEPAHQPFCNLAHSLQRSLNKLNLLEKYEKKVLAQTVLENEIEAGRPIAARIEWENGRGHFLILYGAVSSSKADEELVHIYDPEKKGDRAILVRKKLLAYRGGRWRESYYTHAPPRVP